jgi:mono/diheme cytochrome c family protein
VLSATAAIFTVTPLTVTPFTVTPSLDTPTPSTHPAQKVVLVTLAIVLAVFLSLWAVHQMQRSPYVQNVLALSGDPVKGQEIFQLNCAVCHGNKAQGFVGPTLSHVASHKSRVGLIQQVISGKTPPMPQFQPDPQTMADLLEYLEAL